MSRACICNIRNINLGLGTNPDCPVHTPESDAKLVKVITKQANKMSFKSSKDIAQGAFSHPNMGSSVQVEQTGKEVKITIFCADEKRAEGFARNIVQQLKGGMLQLTIGGKVSKVEES